MHRRTSNQSNAGPRATEDRVRQARRRVRLARKSSRASAKGRSVKAWKS